MRWLIVAGVIVAAVVAVVVALAATGPTYEVYCGPGHEVYVTDASFRSYYAADRQVCLSKYSGKRIDAQDFDPTRLRRLGLFERAWYNLAGSENTRG